MSTVNPPISFSLIPAIPPEPVLRLSVQQYHEMIRSGIIDEGALVELLDGWLVPNRAKKPRHIFTTEQIREEFGRILPAGWFIRAQDPITTSDSEPEPDIGVVRGERRDYLSRHPGPEDLGMIVEVSESTFTRDRGVKKTLYARAKVPVYWIVDLIGRKVEVYRDPTGPCNEPDYRRPETYGENDRIPVVLYGQEIGKIEVKQILP